MKKVLFATTAIVAFAGAAAADVAVSGSAELGIADMDHNGDDEVGFFSSVDVRFAMTGETDGGLAFGATVDLRDMADMTQAVQDGTDMTDNAFADYQIFVSGAFGTLTFGDTDGAMDWALTEGGNVGNPGSIADGETSYSGYAGSYLDGNGDGMIARYDYSFGDYAFAVSVEQGVADAENGFAVGFKGNVAGVSFGIAHQAGTENATGDAELTGVSLGYGFGALNAGIMVATGEDRVGADRDLMQIGLGYSAGALSLHANYAEDDVDGTGKADGIGVAAKYDLGGGAGVHFGYQCGPVITV